MIGASGGLIDCSQAWRTTCSTASRRSIGIPFLRKQLALLLSDPVQPGNGIDTDDIRSHVQGCGNTYIAVWRIHAQMDMLDVFPDHIDVNVAQVDVTALLHGQYSCFWASMIRKMRSTSPSSFRMSHKACLITFSRGSTPRQPCGRTRLTAASSSSASPSTCSEVRPFPNPLRALAPWPNSRRLVLAQTISDRCHAVRPLGSCPASQPLLTPCRSVLFGAMRPVSGTHRPR